MNPRYVIATEDGPVGVPAIYLEQEPAPGFTPSGEVVTGA